MDDISYMKPELGNFKKRPHNQLDNGKRKRQNSHFSQDDNSGTPKVTETLYRILCPVQKMGSILGKGGEIVRAIRDETGAKIRAADAIPGAEERVVIVFNYPSKESEKSANDQEPKNGGIADHESDMMRPHCPAQDALLKVHDRISADEHLSAGAVHEKTDPDNTVTARILVPNSQVGCLLGKGGTVIQKLRSDYTGTNIRVLSSEHLPPCAVSGDELVQISGAPEVVKKALYDISTRLHQHPRKENPPVDDLIYASARGSFQPGASKPPPPPIRSSQQHDIYGTPPRSWFGGHRNEAPGNVPSSYNSSHGANEGDTPEEFSMRILCPVGKIGWVIGKAGASIRQLEHDTFARIQVEDTSPEAEERIINVTSREGPWDQVSPTIEAVLQLQVRTSAATEDSTITTRLLVPSSKVGCLLGQRGSIIMEMRHRTRADIKVYSKEDKPSYISANEELVQISGNHDVARESLLEIASRLRTRTFRSGDTSINRAPVIPDRVFPRQEIIPDFEFTRPQIMPGRGLPSSHRIGAPENPTPVYAGHGFAPHENISSRVQPSSFAGRTGNGFSYGYPKRPEPPSGAQGYPPVPPSGVPGYSDLSGAMEIMIPRSAMHSVLGAGGSNISDIRKISGAWVKLQDPRPSSSECVVEIRGTSEQMKAAQSLVHAFVASGRQNTTQPPLPSSMHAPLYRQY